jgi:predicted HNH restriction endonuclease
MGAAFLCSLFLWERPVYTPAGQRVARMIRRGGTSVHHDEAIERFYTTRAWRKVRASFLTEKGGLCEICLGKGLIVPAVHVHHRKPITPENLSDPMVALDSSNLMALCEECHAEQHRTKRWRVDPLGHVRL